MRLIYKSIRKPRKALSESKYLIERALGSNDYQPFLILTRSRTGSTLLSQSLDSHSNIRCRAEMFNKLNDRSPNRIFNSIYGKHPSRIQAAGFKIFYYHPHDADGEPIWQSLVNIENLKVIQLVRQNILRSLVSRKIAAQVGNYQYQKTIETSTVQKVVELSPEELLEGFQETEEMEANGIKRFSGHETISLTYEDMILDPQATFKTVQEFLGVTHQNLHSPLKRQNPEPLTQLISNFSELEIHFKDTKWARYFSMEH